MLRTLCALQVLAYRCLVKEDDREAPSFLFESVVNGTQQVGVVGVDGAGRGASWRRADRAAVSGEWQQLSDGRAAVAATSKHSGACEPIEAKRPVDCSGTPCNRKAAWPNSNHNPPARPCPPRSPPHMFWRRAATALWARARRWRLWRGGAA